MGNRDGSIVEEAQEIEAAAVEEVFVEGEEDLVEEARATPEAIAAIDGRVGGVAGGQGLPGGAAADLPKNSIENRAGVQGRAAARGGRGVCLEEGLEEAPLLVGEVQEVYPSRSLPGKARDEPAG